MTIHDHPSIDAFISLVLMTIAFCSALIVFTGALVKKANAWCLARFKMRLRPWMFAAIAAAGLGVVFNGSLLSFVKSDGQGQRDFEERIERYTDNPQAFQLLLTELPPNPDLLDLQLYDIRQKHPNFTLEQALHLCFPSGYHATKDELEARLQDIISGRYPPLPPPPAP